MHLTDAIDIRQNIVCLLFWRCKFKSAKLRALPIFDTRLTRLTRLRNYALNPHQ